MRSLRKRQLGMTIPELLIAVITAGILAAAAGKGIEYATRSNSASNLATQGVTVYDSLQSYVATNIDALISSTPVTGVANPMAPTQAEMQALGYRTFSTTSTAGSGITWNYSLTLTPTGCAPKNCNILVYVGLSGAPRLKDNTVDLPLVAQAANETGRPAGFSTSGSPTVITGLGGAWTLPNPVGSQAGILCIYGSYGAGQFGNYVRMGDTRPVTLNNTLAVQGAQTVGGTLGVTGNTALGSALSVSGNTAVGGALAVAGNGSVAGNQTVGGSVTSNGNVHAAVSVVSNANAVNYNGSTYNISDNWGMLTYAGNAGSPWMNAEPQSGRGSLHVNDIYIRSIGKWASQLGNSKTLVGYGSVAGQDWIYVNPPAGASTASHRIYAYATEFNQCNWERQHANNWAFEMGNAPVFLQGSAVCPGWSSISYVSFAVPH